MAINIANDNDDVMGLVEENTSYTMRELMDKLLLERDIIVTVPAEQEQVLREGLIMRKSKDNKQAKTKNLLPNTGVLEFNSYPAKDSNDQLIPDAVCVRVTLTERKSVQVIKLEVPSNDF